MSAVMTLDAGRARGPGYDGALPYHGVRLVDDLESDFQLGDESALRRAYDEHGSLVYTFCRRAVGSTAADDITQEVFLAAWRARERFDPGRGSLRAWLMGIARNKLIDSYRRQSRRPESIEADVGDTPTDERSIDGMADRMLVASALDELPERARRVVELAFLQQLSHSEIVEQTGLPLGTIKSDIRRSLGRMRRHLEGVS